MEVQPAGQHGRTATVRPPEVAETATKPSPAPFQKHSLGGCTIDMPLWNCRRRMADRFAVRYLVQWHIQEFG